LGGPLSTLALLATGPRPGDSIGTLGPCLVQRPHAVPSRAVEHLQEPLNTFFKASAGRCIQRGVLEPFRPKSHRQKRTKGGRRGRREHLSPLRTSFGPFGSENPDGPAHSQDGRIGTRRGRWTKSEWDQKRPDSENSAHPDGTSIFEPVPPDRFSRRGPVLDEIEKGPSSTDRLQRTVFTGPPSPDRLHRGSSLRGPVDSASGGPFQGRSFHGFLRHIGSSWRAPSVVRREGPFF